MELKKKIQSRKFIVWIMATIFVLLVMLAYFLSNDPALTSVMETFAESWGWVSVIYIGGNVVSKKLGGKHGLSDFNLDNSTDCRNNSDKGLDNSEFKG